MSRCLLIFLSLPLAIGIVIIDYGWAEETAVTEQRSTPVKAPVPDPYPRKSDYRIIGLGRRADSRCETAYLSPDGTYGTRADVLINEILKSPMRSYFFDKVQGMTDWCPLFDKFSVDQKLNFWVALFTHLGDFESDCRTDLYVPCTGGMCGGDFQIKEAASGRTWRAPSQYKSAYAGGGCNAKYSTGGHWSTSLKNNIACSVQIMAGTLCGFYKTNNGKCTSNSSPFSTGYWQPINNGNVRARMKDFPLCKIRELSQLPQEPGLSPPFSPQPAPPATTRPQPQPQPAPPAIRPEDLLEWQEL